MKLNKHGLPILDPPSEANKLTPHCKPGTHLWITVNSPTLVHGSNEQVRQCTRCDLVSSFTSEDDKPWSPSLPSSRRPLRPKFDVLIT